MKEERLDRIARELVGFCSSGLTVDGILVGIDEIEINVELFDDSPGSFGRMAKSSSEKLLGRN